MEDQRNGLHNLFRFVYPNNKDKPLKLNVDELKKEEKAKEFEVEVTNRFATLGELKEEITPTALWKTVKTVLMKTTRDTVGYKKPEKHTSWIRAQTMERIKEKSIMKHKDRAKYRALKAEVQNKLRQDKQKQLDDLCNELKIANKRGNIQKLFQIAKTITRKFQTSLNCIKSKTGENITSIEQIAEWWKGNCQGLYEGKDNMTNWNLQLNEQEPLPLISEVKRALKDTANQKASGPDGITIELIKIGGKTTIKRMHQICVTIWKTGEWLED